MQISQEPSQSSQEQAYRDADLNAQISMSWAAWVTACFSGIGLVGLLFTVRYALFAWKAAQKSADADEAALVQARLATSAAWKSEETAREIGQKQSMAYVHISAAYTPAMYEKEDVLVNALMNHRARLLVDVENIGNTVAKYVTLYIELVNDTDPKHWPKFRELTKPQVIETSNLAPSQVMPIEVSRDLTGETELTGPETENDFAIRILRGIVTYESVFGDKYRTAFIYPIFFRPSKGAAPPKQIDYKAFPFNGPAFEPVPDPDSE